MLNPRKRSWYGGVEIRDYKRSRTEAPVVPGRVRQSLPVNQGTMVLSKSRAATGNKRSNRFRKRRRIFRRRRIAKGISWSKCVQLRTVFPGQHNPAAGVIGVDAIALNGGNDPTLAISNQQPLYWDQYCALYRRYCIVGWKIKIEVVTSDNTVPTTFGFCPLTTSTPLASQYHYKETAGNVSAYMTPDLDKTVLYAKGGVERYLLGNKRRGRMLSDDNLYALTSANPTNVLYGHIYSQAFDATADPATLNYIATLYQTIVFFDPIVPARS